MLGSLITAGASILGGMLGASGQRDANRANLQIAREQMDFQKTMSGTAYQRAVADMERAGLNPMLAYSQGGASTPPGASAKMENVLGAGVSSAMASGNLVAAAQQAQQSQAMTDQIQATTKKIESETMEHDVNAARALAQLREEKARGVRTEEEIPKTRHESMLKQQEYESRKGSFYEDIMRRRAESRLTQMDIPRMEAEEKFYEGLGKSAPYLRFFIDLMRGGASASQIRSHR